MTRERVLITVIAYPIISEKYYELSCTAGFRDDGTWIRLYPIPLRLLEKQKRFKKYHWFEVDIVKNSADRRPESYKVIDFENIKQLNKIGTSSDWEERRKLILKQENIHTDMKQLINLAHRNMVSLAVFKPEKVIGLIVKETEPEWPQDKVRSILDELKQRTLFEDESLHNFRLVRKLPKKFSYCFRDSYGKESSLMIEDWELGVLYWKYADKFGPTVAVEKVREKYFDDFVHRKDLYLFLGTTFQWHNRRGPNPFVIIGVFYPPFVKQPSLPNMP